MSNRFRFKVNYAYNTVQRHEYLTENFQLRIIIYSWIHSLGWWGSSVWCSGPSIRNRKLFCETETLFTANILGKNPFSWWSSVMRLLLMAEQNYNITTKKMRSGSTINGNIENDSLSFSVIPTTLPTRPPPSHTPPNPLHSMEIYIYDKMKTLINNSASDCLNN